MQRQPSCVTGAAIAPRPASSTELVSDDFPVFHCGHDARVSMSATNCFAGVQRISKPLKESARTARQAQRLSPVSLRAVLLTTIRPQRMRAVLPRFSRVHVLFLEVSFLMFFYLLEQLPCKPILRTTQTLSGIALAAGRQAGRHSLSNSSSNSFVLIWLILFASAGIRGEFVQGKRCPTMCSTIQTYIRPLLRLERLISAHSDWSNDSYRS
jgi:hypothetical protein